MTDTTRTMLVGQLRAAAAYLASLIDEVEAAESHSEMDLIHLASDAVGIGTRIEVAFGDALDPVSRTPVRW